MDKIDQREARAERNINSRHTAGGKGDGSRTSQKDFSEGYSIIDWGNTKHIDDGLYIKDLYDSDKFHNDYTFEGERIRSIVPSTLEGYWVRFDDKPTIKLDKWAICKEVDIYNEVDYQDIEEPGT